MLALKISHGNKSMHSSNPKLINPMFKVIYACIIMCGRDVQEGCVGGMCRRDVQEGCVGGMCRSLVLWEE